MHHWAVKGSPSRNDLDHMLAPGGVERWVTRKPPREWAPGDAVFFWKSAPALRLMGLGRIEGVNVADMNGDAFFDLTYLTSPLEDPLTIDELRLDGVVGTASFLKAGAAGTIFPLTAEQAHRLWDLVYKRNPRLPAVDGSPSRPSSHDGERVRALSVRQPWAELIMRGIKSVEVRSIRTNIRDRVYIYASLGNVPAESQERVRDEYGVDVDALPRGVLVGTVEIVACRPLKTSDSSVTAFPVERDTTDFAWVLSRPERAEHLRKPTKHPQPVFFIPF